MCVACVVVSVCVCVCVLLFSYHHVRPYTQKKKTKEKGKRVPRACVVVVFFGLQEDVFFSLWTFDFVLALRSLLERDACGVGSSNKTC